MEIPEFLSEYTKDILKHQDFDSIEDIYGILYSLKDVKNVQNDMESLEELIDPDVLKELLKGLPEVKTGGKIPMEWEIYDIASEIEDFVSEHLDSVQFEKFRKLHRLYTLHVNTIMEGGKEFSWKWLHENKMLCLNDYEIFEELSEWKEEVVDNHNEIFNLLKDAGF